MSNLAMMMGLGSGAGGVAVADVFSTTLYTGNATADTKITTGVDLNTNGGLLWTKKRSASADHYLFDTENAFDGALSGSTSKRLKSNDTSSLGSESNALTSFDTDGFTISTNGAVNGSGSTYVSWTWCKAAGFFDVVAYDGNGVSGRAIDHNLNSDVGMIIVKSTTLNSTNWRVFHRSLGATQVITLNSTSGAGTSSSYWADTEPTSTQFTIGNVNDMNNASYKYVAYLFAHNEDLIQCGSFSGNDATVNVDLGWQPQFIIVKNSNNTMNWHMYDNERGAGAYLFAEADSQEFTDSSPDIVFNSTGFDASGNLGISGRDYIYMAIKAED
jgi:hypothetical protein